MLDYCFVSLLWSAFFFGLGYLTCHVLCAVQNHLGKKDGCDHT